MRRREFFGLIFGASAWPSVAAAQQTPLRRVGVLTGGSGPASHARIATFVQALGQLGWNEGQNVRLEIRQGGADPDTIHKHAAELAALKPDVIVTIGGT